MRPKKALVFSDLHTGSRYGLNLPEYLSPIDKKFSPSMKLYDCYLAIRDAVGKLDYVFCLGDTCDGWNPREHGDDRIAEENRQVEIAVKLLKGFKGSPKLYCVDGSKYHRNVRMLDERVAEAVGSPKDKRFGKHAPPSWTIEIENVTFNLAHFVSVSKSTWQYRTTHIARSLVLAKLNQLPADILLRGHAHYFTYAGFVTRLAMVCPGFQAKTPFLDFSSPENEARWGAVLFRVKDGRWDWSIEENGQFMIWKPDLKKYVEKAK